MKLQAGYHNIVIWVLSVRFYRNVFFQWGGVCVSIFIYRVSAGYKLSSNIWTLIQIVYWSLTWSVYKYSLTLLALVIPRF